jgi:hypothetical protein
VRRLGVIVLLALLAGCGGSASASEAPLPSIIDPDVVGLRCGDGDPFHPALVREPGRAEGDRDPAAGALVEFLGGPNRAGLPASGWIRVGQLAGEARFIAPSESAGGWFVVKVAAGPTGWTVEDRGRCEIEVVGPEGVTRADWRLDPAVPRPAGGDRTIHVVLTERACSGGQSPEGRIEPPVISTTEQAVIIAFFVRQVPGGNDCPGNPEFPLEVELPEPLGDRLLLDGGVFPPVPPGEGGEPAAVGETDVDCGPVGPERCAELARHIVDLTEQEYGVEVLWLQIKDDKGSYQLGMPGGLEVGLIVD